MKLRRGKNPHLASDAAETQRICRLILEEGPTVTAKAVDVAEDAVCFSSVNTTDASDFTLDYSAILFCLVASVVGTVLVRHARRGECCRLHKKSSHSCGQTLTETQQRRTDCAVLYKKVKS